MLFGESAITLTLQSGASLRIYPPINVSGDSLFVNTLNYRSAVENTQIVNIRADGLDRLVDNHQPQSYMRFAVEDISTITIMNHRRNYFTFGALMLGGAVIGYSMPVSENTSQVKTNKSYGTIIFSAVGALIGYFIGEYIDQKNMALDTTILNFSELSIPEKKDLLLSSKF